MILRMGGWLGARMPPRRLSLARLALSQPPFRHPLTSFFLFPRSLRVYARQLFKESKKKKSARPCVHAEIWKCAIRCACVCALALGCCVLRVVLCFFNGCERKSERERKVLSSRDHKKWIKCASEWTDFDSARARGFKRTLLTMEMQGKWICLWNAQTH